MSPFRPASSSSDDGTVRVKLLPTNGAERWKRRALTDREMGVLLNVSGPHSLQIRAIYWLDLRRSEAENLRWDDVKLDANPSTIRLPASITKNGKVGVPVLDDLATLVRMIRCFQKV